MLNVKKTLTKILTNCIRHTNKSVTVGSSQYDGYYYADCEITLPSGAEVIAVTNWNTTSNRSAITQRMWQVGNVLTVRVWTKQANTTVDIRVSYIGGGYCITLLLSTFVRCLGRRWSYAEHEENAYESADKSERTDKGCTVRMGIKSFGYGRESAYPRCKSVELLESGRQTIRVHVQGLADVYNEWVGWLCLPGIANNRNHRYLDNFSKKLNVRCEHLRSGSVYQKRPGIATTPERGWAVC